MTFVVVESCIKCKTTECVEVCPVEAFKEGPNFLVIDPDECIDCTICVPECPVDAIFADDEVPEDQQDFIEINEILSEKWPVIDSVKERPSDYEEWKEIKDKRQFIEEYLD